MVKRIVKALEPERLRKIVKTAIKAHQRGRERVDRVELYKIVSRYVEGAAFHAEMQRQAQPRQERWNRTVRTAARTVKRLVECFFCRCRHNAILLKAAGDARPCNGGASYVCYGGSEASWW